MAERSNVREKGCLFLFALPFLAVGILSFAKAVRTILSGNYEISEIIILIVLGMIFGGVGVGILLGTRYGSRMMKKEALLRERHPDEPWKWREEWATNRIKGPGKGALAFTWFFAIFWNLISWTVIGANYKDLLEKKDWKALFVLLFPLIGIGLLVWALRVTIRWRKFGKSILHLDRLPVAIGGKLTGTIQTGIKEFPEGGVILTLNCIRKIRTGGRSSSSRESILWQEEARAGREHLFRSPEGYGVPVEISIPSECKETSMEAGKEYIFWRLHAKAAVPGVDFDTSFVVPVFKTGERVEQSTGETESELFSREETSIYDPRSGTARVFPSPSGGSEFYFGPMRNPGMALSMLVFCAIWFGFLWPFYRSGVPRLFLLFFVIPGILLLLFLLRLLTSTTRVVADAHLIRIHRGVLGLTLKTNEIPRDQIENIKLRIGMQKSSTHASAGRPYYSIDVYCRDGSKVVAGRNVGDKSEAEWIAAELKRILGIGERNNSSS